MPLDSLYPRMTERHQQLLPVFPVKESSSTCKISLLAKNSSNRCDVEYFIQQKYFEVYGAKITDFMPNLLVMHHHDQVEAVSGIRPTTAQTLFVENYLTGTIEQEMAAHLGIKVEREKIAEIGNFASIGKGSSRLLFVLLAAICQRANFEWVVFTGTPQIRKSLNLSGFNLHCFGTANPAFLTSNEYKKWGTYYQTSPQVSTCNVAEAMQVIIEKPRLHKVLKQYENLINNMAAALQTGRLNEQHTYAT
jgi:hypothetical protein